MQIDSLATRAVGVGEGDGGGDGGGERGATNLPSAACAVSSRTTVHYFDDGCMLSGHRFHFISCEDLSKRGNSVMTR